MEMISEHISYDEARKRVIVAEKLFESVGLPLVKIFKAPFWQLSKYGENALKDLGYKVVKDGYFDWSYDQPFPTNKKKVIGHGHCQNTCGNGLEETLPNFMKIPKNIKFKFLSEMI